MSDINIVVVGVSGRMGQMLVDAVNANAKTKLIGAIERSEHPWVGQDLGLCMGGGMKMDLIVRHDPLDVFAKAHAILDFTAPDATVYYAQLAKQMGAVHVIGTTGMDENHLNVLNSCAHDTVIVRAGNMSLGVNLLTKLTEKIAATLGEDYDIEVIETHHRNKVDAPSGTALMLGEAAAKGRGVPLKEVEDRARDGFTGERKRGAIGFHAIRGGDIVGEHDVIFAANGERIILRHLATDRAIFARGAVRAAIWGQTQKPGQYDMMDVLGL